MIDAAIHCAITAVLSPERLAATVPLHAAWQHRTATGDARADHRQSRISAQRWGEARERVSSEFGAACGWHRGRPFSPMQLARGGSIGNREDREWMRRGARSTLAWDHAEYFRRRRAPAGIIVHVYGEPPCADCHDLARTHGLEFKMLPWSWYYPTGTTAGLYLGRLADVVPFRRRA